MPRRCRGARFRLDYRSPLDQGKGVPADPCPAACRLVGIAPPPGLPDQAERPGRHRPRSAHARGAAGALARGFASWVVNSSLRGLLDGHPYFDEVIAYDRRDAPRRRGGLPRFARFLAGLRLPAVRPGDRPSGPAPLGGDDGRDGGPGPRGAGRRPRGGHLFYTHRIDAPRGRRCARGRPLLSGSPRRSGPRMTPPRFVVAASDEDRLWARAVLADVPAPRLDPERRGALADQALAARALRRGRAAGERVARRGSGRGRCARGPPARRELLRTPWTPVPVLDLCGRTTLPQLAALAGEADLYLSNDSGPLHLAAAAGARVVGVYTCTSPRLTGPYGPNAATVQSGVWCAPSYRENLPPPRMHDRTDPRPRLADGPAQSTRRWRNGRWKRNDGRWPITDDATYT